MRRRALSVKVIALASVTLAVGVVSACTAFDGTEGAPAETAPVVPGEAEAGALVEASVEDGGARPPGAPLDAVVASNGHAYKVVVSRAVISWKQAKVAAEDLGGHLATITDPDEQAFVARILQVGRETFYVTDGERRMGPWLGGTQLPDAGEPGGGWSWVTGEPFGYTHWRTGEPNNGGTGATWNEASLFFFFSAKEVFGDQWADGTDIENITSYVVEWEP